MISNVITRDLRQRRIRIMIINMNLVKAILMDESIPADHLEIETGVSRSAITRVRNDERKIENLKLETIIKVQKWINSGKYTLVP